MVVVEVPPFGEFVVEQLRAVDDEALELAVELFGVDAEGALDFAVQPRGSGLDLDVPDAAVGLDSMTQHRILVPLPLAVIARFYRWGRGASSGPAA
jgi:hypothetical protein